MEKLRNSHDVQPEIESIQSEEKQSSEQQESTLSIWQLLQSPKLRLCLFVCICLHLSQQLSGMVAIFYYSTKFFEDAGINKDSSQYATLGVGAILVTMTLGNIQ